MGISNLLPLLQPSTERVHISEFRGKTVAVDSYCWLHKGARGCAMKLARGEDTNSYVEYVMKRVKLLLHHNITPIMVFDGRPLPAKLKTEAKRRNAKKLARAYGMECLRLGQTDEAYKYFCQYVEVTPAMALALMKECRKINIDCVVAPYEADAQLAFLSINNLVDLVITEDSDLLAFGCKKVLFKLDEHGIGQLIDSERIHVSMKIRKTLYSLQKLRHLCILGGCDYLDSLPKMELKKVLTFITMTYETDPNIFLDRLPRYLRRSSIMITPEYKRNFLIADATFRHQTVFDTKNKILIPLTPITLNSEYCLNVGDMFDDAQATQLALGNLNPLTMEPIDDWSADNTNTAVNSIWRVDCSTCTLPPTEVEECLQDLKAKEKDTYAQSVWIDPVVMMLCEVILDVQNEDPSLGSGPPVSQPATETEMKQKRKGVSEIGPCRKVLKQMNIMDAFKKATMKKPNDPILSHLSR